MATRRHRRFASWILDSSRQPSFWAIVALAFVAFLLGWVYQLNRDTHELARENRATLASLKEQERKLTDAIRHQCATDAAHDIAVRAFIRTTKDLDALEALFGLHFLLIDQRTCKDVTG